MVTRLLSLSLFPCIFWCSSLGLPSATVEVTATADTGMFEDFPDNNLGGAATVPSGTLAGVAANGNSRALVKFDLPSELAPGAIIETVSVRMRVTRIPRSGAVDSTFGLHRLRMDWGEGSKASGATSGTGAAATMDEATWNSRFHPQSPWATPGGEPVTDYVTEPSSSTFVSGVESYTFPSTTALVADVQAWTEDPASNHGWILVSASEGTSGTARRWATRENTVADRRPVLTINFSPPPPRLEQILLVEGNLQFTFTAQATKRYEVQKRPLAGSGEWITFTNIGPVNVSGPITISDPADAGTQFYQVIEF